MIGELAQQGYGQRLAPEHPFLEAEVVYCATNGKFNVYRLIVMNVFN